MRVLVVHPGLQYSHQLAWGLESAGHLEAFWSGVPVVESQSAKSGSFSWNFLGLREVPIATGRRSHAVIFPLLRRLLGWPIFSRVSGAWNHRLERTYDLYVAAKLSKVRPDMVVCYENSALHTFRSAKKLGVICVLDAASVHYRSASQWLPMDRHVNSALINSEKQQEIELADAILTCSEFAARTYSESGVDPEKIFPVPLGATFIHSLGHKNKEPHPCRFVFVGSVLRRKGVDLLLDIFDELYHEGVSAELTIIGGGVEADLSSRANRLPNVRYFSFMAQSELFDEVAKCHCLVLPSRFDSFGMVVAEAMAVGVPAIVSDRVGAKCIIEQHPAAGWIVACDKDELKSKIVELVRNPQTVLDASRAALTAAQDYTWERYRTRVVATLEGIYAEHQTKPL